MSAAQYFSRQARLWCLAFFVLLFVAIFACLFCYFIGHKHGKEFIEKKAAIQMYFSNDMAGAGADTPIRRIK